MELTPTLKLAQALVRIPSVTPDDNGCQKLISDLLKKADFICCTLEEAGTTNLLATHGTGSPFLLFLGHTDVVPTGDPSKWQHDPFCGDIFDMNGEPCLYGRGSADMKGGDAAMVIAMIEFVKVHPNHKGTIGLLITSNEEGDAKGGVPFVVEYMKNRHLIPDYCIVGEPSCDEFFGDFIKNGHRGDLNATIIVKGKQGHVGQPEYCDNAAHKAARFINVMVENPIDNGSEYFTPTSFQVSNIKCGTGADNVVPGSCYLRCNWRYNDLQSKESIEAHVKKIIESLKLDCELTWQVDGLPFLTKGGELMSTLSDSVTKVLGRKPAFATKGGTSDGRFIAPLGAQTVEFGVMTTTIHQVDEHASIKNLEQVKEIFYMTLEELM